MRKIKQFDIIRQKFKAAYMLSDLETEQNNRLRTILSDNEYRQIVVFWAAYYNDTELQNILTQIKFLTHHYVTQSILLRAKTTHLNIKKLTLFYLKKNKVEE